ncbi:MAG: hypothetical protein HYS26_03640 [Candidatus Kaiserbacteria bacterium]|nr:MAG: hypothetical protein HYS26_03640 [Candidatus Kaiserbacteria bacterium]
MQLVQRLPRIDQRHALIGAWLLLALSGAIVFSSVIAPAAAKRLSVAGGNNSFVGVPDIPNTGASSAPTGSLDLPAAMITFDIREGFQSAYLKALPLFDDARLKASYTVIPEYIGYLGYINEAQLASVQKRGHEVSSTDGMVLRTIKLSSEIPWEEVKSSIDAAVESKEWIVIQIYRVDESSTHDGKNVSLDLLKRVLASVRAEGLRVVTFDEGEKIADLSL